MAGSRWDRWLFVGLALLYLLPIWVVRFVPTTDGPCHLYNSWILRQLLTGEAPPVIEQHYEVNPRPFPNWSGQAMMALLLGAVPPAAAEKIVASSCVLLFLLGLRYLAGSVDPARGWFAFLGFPLAYNWTFQMGFYNFALSLGLFLFAVGFWWRRRERLSPRGALGLNALLLAVYFSHILSLLFALFAIGVLWLATLRKGNLRNHLLQIPLLAPQAVLPLWFIASQEEPTIGGALLLGDWWRYLRRLEILFTFSPEQLQLGSAVAALFALLAVWTLAQAFQGGRPRPEDGFLLLAALFVLLFFVAPDTSAGGSLIKHRLSLYPYLMLVPWFSARTGRWVKPAGVVLLTLLALANLAWLTRWYRTADRETAVFLAGLEATAPQARVLTLLFDRRGPVVRFDLFGHATARAALDKALIDWDNYQAATDFFPVRFKPVVQRPDIWPVYADPANLRLAQWAPKTEYIYAWKMPPDAPVAERLLRRYKLVAESGGGKLFERRP
ncbi:MAG TPA: hypothetical protein VMW27_24745 [Thermoanaerobaculia bacterium]|nr:hypothetical protein [Thermoanaerobaculia bacterium]